MTGATRSELSPRLLRAYRQTHYEAAGIAIRIGRRCAALDALLRQFASRHGGLITAWNPASRRLPDGINRRRQLRLKEHLRRHRVASAQGRLHRWREDMLLVAADPRRLLVLARRHGQSAIVVLTTGQKARLAWCVAFVSPAAFGGRRGRVLTYRRARRNSRRNGSSVVPSACGG